MISLTPQLLNEPWFLLLSAFVSFNTIVFVGLSLGKVSYWPKVRIQPKAAHTRSVDNGDVTPNNLGD